MTAAWISRSFDYIGADIVSFATSPESLTRELYSTETLTQLRCPQGFVSLGRRQNERSSWSQSACGMSLCSADGSKTLTSIVVAFGLYHVVV